VARAHTDIGEDAAQHFVVAVIELLDLNIVLVANQFAELGGDLAHRQDEIGEPGGDRVARHRRVLGLVRILDQDDAAGFLDRLDPDGASVPAPVRTTAAFWQQPERGPNPSLSKFIVQSDM
jgi:hypothetical protein